MRNRKGSESALKICARESIWVVFWQKINLRCLLGGLFNLADTIA